MDNGLNFELPIGLYFDGAVHKEVTLLELNGVAEKIFLKKIAGKPYTWQGNVVSAGVKSIGNVEIGGEVRKKFLEDNAVTIPKSVLALPLAEVNTLIVEIHRRLWESILPKQTVGCRHCGQEMVVEIDLMKIDYLDEAKERIVEIAEAGVTDIKVTLRNGFQPPVIKGLTDKEEYAGITATTYNQFTFRIPTLEDAIKNEKYVSDNIAFWRRIAIDCLVSIDLVEDGIVKDTLPRQFHTFYGLKMFNEYLGVRDLKEIRKGLVESLPTLPFAYMDICPHCDKETPMIMEASSFFSE